jgi:DNA-binding transcriptional LysR family regulator
MLLRQLEYLVALAREKHFARGGRGLLRLAAFAVRGDPQAGARAGRADRAARPALRGGLPPEGERVLEWAHKVLAEREALQQELSQMRGGLAGTLRIGAIPTALTATSLPTTPGGPDRAGGGCTRAAWGATRAPGNSPGPACCCGSVRRT